VQIAECGFLVVSANDAQASVARAFGDHGLLFYFKILIDIFALNAQLASGVALWAA
jgi:hypothetical protein